MISILKATEDSTDVDSLEKLSSKYDFLYIHPVSTRLNLSKRLAPDVMRKLIKFHLFRKHLDFPCWLLDPQLN